MSGGYISKITFNNNQSVEINANDIVVFVGANNVGKSQTLKDIYKLCDRKVPTMVVEDIDIVKYDVDLDKFLPTISHIKNMGAYKEFSGMGFYFNSYSVQDYAKEKRYGQIRDIFVAYLDTMNRLSICNPPELISRNAEKRHPIHYAAFNGKYRIWLSENFKKAFGKDLIPFTQNGSNIPLCIGDVVKFDTEFDDEQLRQEAYSEILETYKQVQDQGDGIKSFTGILLYLMLDYYSTFLIDEPESFLHPPQANIMGRIIGETLQADQQAFISTHSEEIIKGLLEVCPDRIKIVRIKREGDYNSISVLDNERFSEIWNDPLLKYSNIMTSLFHKEVMLCESDSDCKMYSVIEHHLKYKVGKYSETLFIHCGGKHRMAKIASALRSLDIDVKLIPDLDVLNDECIFKGIATSFDVDWESIKKDYNIIASNLHSSKEAVDKNKLLGMVSQIVNESENPNLSLKEINTIKAELKTESKWEALKKNGITALPSGDATVAFQRLDQVLRNAGIFIVPVGELECFVKQVGGHGPDWVNKVLETYPDLDNKVYDEIKKFIAQVCCERL